MYGHEMNFIVHSRKHLKKLFQLGNLFSKLSQRRAIHAFCFSTRDPCRSQWKSFRHLTGVVFRASMQ